MSKIAQAVAIVAANPQASRSELIQMFMDGLSMSKAGATTYYYNATKNLITKPSVAKKSKAPTKTVKAKSKVSKVSKVDTKMQSEVRAELDRINAEMDEFEKTHTMHKNGLVMVKKSDVTIDRV